MLNRYKNIETQMPPLDTYILIKKGAFKIHNDAKVVVLDAHEASQEWHVDNLVADGYTDWFFVNDSDEIEWSKRRNKEYVELEGAYCE